MRTRLTTAASAVEPRPLGGAGVRHGALVGLAHLTLAKYAAQGPSPFVATALFATFQSSLPIALYILGCAIIGIIATALLTDYTNKDISAEYERV